jgi:ArsR family transcriptional regulator, arsenate/arsenite/antimonite-responsive transcriptional repressor
MAKGSLKVVDLPSSASCCPTGTKVRPKATKPYAKLFKALGDETRLEMLGLLAAAGSELCVCDIESHFELSQPTISHHLKILREAHLVTSDRRGTWVYYALDRDTLRLLPEFRALLGS